MKTKIKEFMESRNYRLLNEVLSALTHGVGVVLSIVAIVLLILKGVERGGAMRITTFAIYGSILVIFYLASTLFHSLYFTGGRKVFQIFDHCAIFILIAGTYLPYCLVTIGGFLGWFLLIVIWIMAISGIIYKAIWMNEGTIFSTIVYVVMGWMCLIGIVPLWQNMNHLGFWLLVLGGIAFTLGAIIYSFKKIPFGHVIWHVFVIIGTVLMFFSIYLFV